jgi:hypothetical protein
VHDPREHTWLDAQELLQAPQFLGSLEMSVQVPLHESSELGQPHSPLLHAPEQERSH